MVDVAQGEEPDLVLVEDRWGNPGRVLSRMIRPAITAPGGKLICWGDWSNIEARVLPWLACAEQRLDIFRSIDDDPENTPDVYLQAAAGMYGHDPYKLLRMKVDGDPEVKPIRQRGKIAELALGFAGGSGALQSMAAGYGMIFEAEEAKDIVGRWRAANQWAVEFWDRLWDAFVTAMKNPGETIGVGRVSYCCLEGYLGSKTVVCLLPDGRPLVYRNVHMREFVERDEFEPEVIIEKSEQLVFHGPDGVKKLWKGLLAENITQATAASVLRWTQRSWTPEEDIQPIVGHTHDELLTLIDEEDKAEGEERLKAYMEQDFGWNRGLPTAADVQSNVCYTKALDD
jgi:DNA polymerase